MPENTQDLIVDEQAGASRGMRWFRQTQLAVFTVMGTVAGVWWVVRQRQNYIDRWTPFDLPFPSELLDVLAVPGSAGQPLTFKDNRLTTESGELSFAVVDGIPDFARQQTPVQPSSSFEDTLWFDTDYLLSRLGWQPWRWGIQRVSRHLLARRAAWSAQGSWCLCAPVDPVEVVALAHAYPSSRILCVDPRWARLLEARRHAQAEGLTNLYIVRAAVNQLPLKTGSMASIWSAEGLPHTNQPRQILSELARVLRPEGLLAGLTLIRNPTTALWATDWLGELGRLPGWLPSDHYKSYLLDLGLQNAKFYQAGMALGFVGTL